MPHPHINRTNNISPTRQEKKYHEYVQNVSFVKLATCRTCTPFTGRYVAPCIRTFTVAFTPCSRPASTARTAVGSTLIGIQNRNVNKEIRMLVKHTLLKFDLARWESRHSSTLDAKSFTHTSGNYTFFSLSKRHRMVRLRAWSIKFSYPGFIRVPSESFFART